ncbi:MAG: zinc ABC transporter substrate-binding protein [Pseudoflavonifractor sp.]|nr:zinc ABC transporter substrate-binding protein [Pseudoflavonifractor sp.]
MRRNKINVMLTVMLAVMVALLGSCVHKTGDKPVITVSIQPQKYFLEQITGDKIDVRCLLSSGANPENYEPSMSHLVNLGKSEAYFRIGNIGFESAIVDKVRANNPAIKIYDNSEGIELIKGTHGHAHGDDDIAEVDPHTWSSVKNAKVIAGNMYRAVLDLDPDNRDYYTRNYESFVAGLDSLDNRLSKMLAPCRGRAFVVWHPSLSYFARDYGLEQISIGYESKESSVRSLQSRIDEAVADSAKVFFFQKEFDTRQARVVNEQIGAEMVTINPLDYKWRDEMLIIADAIASK